MMACQGQDSPLLNVCDIRRRFGGVQALDRVSFRVRRGQIKAVIGPNGAGKTTLFNIVAGALRADGGRIEFDGVEVTGLQAWRIAELGVSRTFQKVSLFTNMTALENVMIGRHARTRHGLASAALRLPGQRREERRIRDEALRYLDYVGLSDFAGAPAAALPFGRRRMVELARALATEPKLLLLDEPASGLNTRETDGLAALIRKAREDGITVLLVEHDMSLVMDISDEVLVLNSGAPLAEGAPASVRRNPDVVAAYLGGGFEHA